MIDKTYQSCELLCRAIHRMTVVLTVIAVACVVSVGMTLYAAFSAGHQMAESMKMVELMQQAITK